MLQLNIIFLCVLIALSKSAVIQEEIATEDADSLKSVLKTIEERLDRWDAFYMGRLEPRMIGAATSLANLDTNIRNLQERAHVWDTFQLHVSAWNDQIKSLHSKMNIMNEAYEKFLAPDSQLVLALNSINSKLNVMDGKLEVEWKQSKEVASPIVNEFALKGLLHSVQRLERKLDRIHLRGNHAEVFKSCGKTALEEILRDVSNKVDRLIEDDEDPNPACRQLSQDLRKLENDGLQQSAALRHSSSRRDISQLQRDVEQSYKKLLKHQEKNFDEIEDSLKDIEKRVDDIADDDDVEELIVKKFNQIERQLRGIRAEIDEDDDDDSDEDDKKKRKHKNNDDTDEDDDDSDADDDKKKRKHKKNDDTDEDDDDSDDDDDKKKRRHKKNDDTDEDDDSDDDTRERSNKRKDDDDTDEDDDTRERSKKKRNDTDEDDDEKSKNNDTVEDDDDK